MYRIRLHLILDDLIRIIAQFVLMLYNIFSELPFINPMKEPKDKAPFYIARAVINKVINRLMNRLQYLYYIIFKSWKTFTFQKDAYHYFYHEANTTWSNERAIEIPIIWKIVKKHHGKNILEVGNVLSHYFHYNHDVLDKYEKADGVINQDVINYRPNKKYDLIVTISTLEHVGWDESPREPMKFLQAIKNLESILSKKGKLVITLPLGHNPVMDQLIENGKISFTRVAYLKRISKDNRWQEADLNDVCGMKYNHPFPAANGLFVGMIEKN